MASNRTVFLAIGIAVLLVVVFYLASLRPFGNVGNVTSGDITVVEPTAVEPTAVEPTALPVKAETDAVTSPGESSAESSADESSNNSDVQQPSASTTMTDASDDNVIIYSYNVVNSYPHDPEAFTQGLVWHEGGFYEGTGLRGRSSLRRVNLDDGAVTQRIELSEEFFGEGITIFGDHIFQLTWQAQRGFVYDLNTFEEVRSFTYPTEGWGITHDGEQLIMSDGSAQLFFLDPEALQQERAINVTLRGEPVIRLNELEYINGLIYANIWQTNWIAMIDPETGVTRGMINLEGLLQAPAGHALPVDVLNGIAYDAETERIFVTGKLWPQLYEIELVETPP